MAGRYELSDQRWQMIEDIISPPQTWGILAGTVIPHFSQQLFVET